jgi:hypothetical protein
MSDFFSDPVKNSPFDNSDGEEGEKGIQQLSTTTIFLTEAMMRRKNMMP